MVGTRTLALSFTVFVSKSTKVHICWHKKHYENRNQQRKELSRRAKEMRDKESRGRFHLFSQFPFTFACMYVIQEGMLWLNEWCETSSLTCHFSRYVDFASHVCVKTEEVAALWLLRIVGVAHAHSVLFESPSSNLNCLLSPYKQPFFRNQWGG